MMINGDDSGEALDDDRRGHRQQPTFELSFGATY